MKKLIVVTSILCASMWANAQVYMTQKGEVKFFSTTPVEDINATSKTVGAVLNTATNDLAIQLVIKQFKFTNALMQEHFNENYMESEKYPKASFTGKINEKVDYTKDGVYKVTATGKLTLHGVTKDRTIDGQVTVKSGKITLFSEFWIATADHNIEIPKVVFAKIAEKIKVTANIPLEPKK